MLLSTELRGHDPNPLRGSGRRRGVWRPLDSSRLSGSALSSSETIHYGVPAACHSRRILRGPDLSSGLET